MTVVTIDLAPEEDVLDGRYLDVIIERWLDDCALRMSPESVTGYRSKVRHFQEWWATVGPSQGWQLREADLLGFSRHLSTLIVCRTGKPLEYNTRKEILGRLRSAFHWACRRGHTRPLNCAYWVPKEPEGSGRLRLPISVEDLARMVGVAGKMEFRSDLEQHLRARNQALLAVFIGTGARLSEVAGLSVEDVTLRADGSGDLYIRSAKKVRNREVHQRIACFDRHTGRYLARWLGLQGGTHGPLWATVDGDALTSQIESVRAVFCSPMEAVARVVRD
jgi:site-specific recombinase XerD